MAIKLIALDMDGTVIKSDNTISQNTINTIKRAIESGIIVVPASGRTADLIPDEIKNIKNIKYGAVSNGASVWDFEKNISYKELLLDFDTVDLIMNKVKDEIGFIEIYSRGKAYINRNVMENKEYKHIKEKLLKYIKNTHILCNNLSESRELFNCVEKINIFYLSNDLKLDLKKQLLSFDNISVIFTSDGDMEVTSNLVNKGVGIKYICDKFNISKDEVMAVGDSENDIEMLQFAGMSVAMGNAEKKIKDIARFVTDTNDEEGVAKVINSIL